MGLEQSVSFSSGRVPDWAAVRDRLAAAGKPPQMRMINGELAFPDEAPPADWRELRISLTAGMVTIRRTAPDRVSVVTWGNAEGPVLDDWRAVSLALAEAGGGTVHGPGKGE